jgi:hypothetical protein
MRREKSGTFVGPCLVAKKQMGKINVFPIGVALPTMMFKRLPMIVKWRLKATNS